MDLQTRKLINRTVQILKKLPTEKIHEINEFADFMLKKYEEATLQKGIETLISNSDSFAFLKEEEELYDESDLIEKY